MITVKSFQSSVVKADDVDPMFWSLNDILHSCRTHSLVGCSVGIKEIREFSIHFAEFSGKRLVAYDYFLYPDVEPLSKICSPVPLHLSPATRLLNENPAKLYRLRFPKQINILLLLKRAVTMESKSSCHTAQSWVMARKIIGHNHNHYYMYSQIRHFLGVNVITGKIICGGRPGKGTLKCNSHYHKTFVMSYSNVTVWQEI